MNILKRLPVGLLLIPIIVKAQTLPTVPIYTYSVPNGGYASNGNVTNYTDSVTGTWNLGYDNLNRLTSGTVTPAVNQNQYFCWGYDSFGNRKVQAGSNQPFQTGSPTCQPASSATISNNIASYNNANQITTTNANGLSITPGYDATGNLTDDGINQILYDAENRVCAVFNRNTSAITQYIYDAEGRRVAKGHPANGNTLYCPTGPGDFIPDETYVVGQNGEQVSELDSTGHWIHSNVYAGGQLLATYSQNGSSQLLHFNVTDHLGSRRVQTTAGGAVELTCLNLPFGDSLICTGPGTDATEHHFTGKERDTESGLDYFGARYLGSSMGRWTSPDPSGLDYTDPRDPQTLNLYAYVGNHPLQYVDPYGLSWLNQAPCGGAQYAGLSLAGEVKNFFANLFANCGGGGGGGDDLNFPSGRGSGPGTPQGKPLSQSDISQRVNFVSSHFGSRCTKAYARAGRRLHIPFSLSSFSNALQKNIDQEPGRSEAKYSSADASTGDGSGPGPGGPNSPTKIHLWHDFYTSDGPERQAYVLWHEGTHRYFGIGDYPTDPPSPWSDFNTVFAASGYKGGYPGNTALFTDWIQGGCPTR